MPFAVLIPAAALAALAGCDGPATSTQTPAAGAAPLASAVRRRPAPAFAGSDTCRACHPREHQRWQASHHALAERDIDPAIDHPAFDVALPPETPAASGRPHHDGDTLRITLPGAVGQPRSYTVTRVIGHDPLRQWLVPARGGRWQATALAWDPHAGTWFDALGDDRQPHEWGHWTNRGMNWNAMCADCHNTDVRKNYDFASDAYATMRAEMGVGCEACHGPAGAHVAHQRRYPAAADPTLAAMQAAQRPDAMLDACGACHARRTELTERFTPGDRFGNAFALAIPDETDTWYADGQVREEDYEYASFLMSGMYQAGVRCGDCHDPHALRPVADGNDLCLRCHSAHSRGARAGPPIDPAAHSHHDPGAPGGRCVDCHMPQTTYMQRHARRDHGFTIPDPRLTRDFGIPNACSRCHTDQPLDWVLEAAERWYGRRLDRWTQQRARLIARARHAAGRVDAERRPYGATPHGAAVGDSPGASPADSIAGELLSLIRTETKPIWIATATILLRPHAHEPGVAATLVELLTHESDLVRAAACRSLRPGSSAAVAALRARLADPVRAVRVAAAWALGPRLDQQHAAAAELREFLEHNADQPVGALLLATHLRQAGQIGEAIGRLRGAIAWQPDMPDMAPLYFELGTCLAERGEPGAAAAAIAQACALQPDEADWWHALGLTCAEAGDLLGAAEALERACTVRPAFTRAWYNLGLARNRLRDHDAAIQALRRAVKLEPENPDMWFALAAALRDADRVQDAIRVTRELLRIAPEHAPGRTLLAELTR